MADKKISQLTAASTPLAGTEVLPIVQSGSTVQVSVDNLTDGRAVKMLSAQVGTKTSATGSTISTTFSAGLASASGGTAVAATLCNTVAAADNNETQITFSPASNYSATGAIGVTIESTVSANSALKFYTYNGGLAEAARIDSSGNYIPKNAAKGVNFTANTPAAGMTSQLLNWYEEGTWTPVLRFGGGTTGITYTTQQGRYTRVGRTVTIRFEITLSSKGSSTGEADITGLPFAAANLNAMSVYLYSNFLLTYKVGIAYCNGSTINEIAANGTAAFTDVQFTNTSRFWATCTYQI
jgi:hypothetical protein